MELIRSIELLDTEIKSELKIKLYKHFGFMFVTWSFGWTDGWMERVTEFLLPIKERVNYSGLLPEVKTVFCRVSCCDKRSGGAFICPAGH